MARKGLKNVVRAACTRHGQQTWELFSSDGTRIPAFDAFCAKNSAYVLRTQKRYAEVVARFIDYLIEARVFSESVTSAHLNDVLEAYPTLLAEGSHALAKRVRKSDRDTWLAEVAESLDWAPIRPKSFDSVIPAINRFLRLSESLAQEAVEKAQVLGLAAPKTGFKALIRAIDGIDTISRQEVMAMKQNSMFGNVAKYAPHGLQRPRHLRRPGYTMSGQRRPTTSVFSITYYRSVKHGATR